MAVPIPPPALPANPLRSLSAGGAEESEIDISGIARRAGQVQAPDCSVPAGRPGFGVEGFSFYEESPRVKSPVAVLRLRWAGHFLSCKRFLRWLARFDRECERDSLVTTFYPCRRGWPSTRCCIRPKRARRTGCGRSAPSIRTAAHMARPRKITGASTNLQRCKLLSLAASRAQICEAMSRASSGITPSAR